MEESSNTNPESHHTNNDNNNNNNDNNNNNNNTSNESTEKNKVAPPPPPVVPAVAAPGSQWRPMPYHAAAAAMVMPVPHYARHYMPYPNHHLHYQPPLSPAPHQINGGGEENRTLWVGDLHAWMDEDYLATCFAPTAEVATVKIIRNRLNGVPEGYGFVEFLTHAAAENILQSFAGMLMPNTTQVFRLNWATFSMGEKRSNNGSGQSIFVGDLASDVNDAILHDTFSSKYPSVKSAKVVIDTNTGRSKGYGFVRFGDDNEKSQAMTEMNGVYCSSRPMRIGAATPRKSSNYQPYYSFQGGYVNGTSSQGLQSNGESENTTIFVGGLDATATDEDLRQPFSQHGEIVSIKIPVGKGCGFVQFANRNDAEAALQQLNGTTIGKQTVRLSWGRNPANKHSRAGYGSQWTGPYYGGPFVDGYGYALPPSPHDPSMYAVGYGAYPMYGTHQQVS